MCLYKIYCHVCVVVEECVYIYIYFIFLHVIYVVYYICFMLMCDREMLYLWYVLCTYIFMCLCKYIQVC